MTSKYATAIDPVSIVVKECLTISTAMRKYSSFTAQSGVVALLGGGSEIFINDDTSLTNSLNGISADRHINPFLSGFNQLRRILNKLDNLDSIEALTVLQPFLVIISTSSISGYITSLALDSVQTFFSLNIINESSLNFCVAFRETINTLTHCRFESSDQLSDDAVLLKVIYLMNTTITTHYGEYLSDSILYDVLQSVLSLACNKRRSDVLRKTAELTMQSFTVKIFNNLKNIEPGNSKEIYINDEGYGKNILKEDPFGTMENYKIENDKSDKQSLEESSDTTNDKEKCISSAAEGDKLNSNSDTKKEDEYNTPVLAIESTDDNYGLPVAKKYLGLLLSLIVRENRLKQTHSSRSIGLQLINTAVEVSGDKFPLHPKLFSLISDPIFKCILYIIQNTNRLSLLQSALQLFGTLVITLGSHLQRQIELTLKQMFAIVLNSDIDQTNRSSRPFNVKELMIEQISLMWSRSPKFFTAMFIDYDCSLDRTDLTIDILKALNKLALPDSAATTTNNVPPLCLEGLITLIEQMVKSFDYVKQFDSSYNIPLLQQKERKTEFIKCVNAFNDKPKKGLPLLIEKGFISSDSDIDIAKFLFENNNRMNKKTIGLLLADPDRSVLLDNFIRLYDFKGLRVDEAIRILLAKFRLPGESQQIERIIESFSKRYVECQEYETINSSATNSKKTKVSEEKEDPVMPDSDSVFVLSYSIIMLNTDLHNPQVKVHMTIDDYSNNVKGCYNNGDYPEWYIERIYTSIRDKEIVMPEEHHGNEKWFEDAWNNLISSSTVMTEVKTETDKVINFYSNMDLLHFNRAIFNEVGASIIDTFFQIFEICSDEHIAAKMLSCIDQCSKICRFYGLKSLLQEIVIRLTKLTSLVGSPSVDENDKLEEETALPLVEINFEDSNSKVAVSSVSVNLGRSLKEQLSLLSLFKIIKENQERNLLSLDICSDITQIILVLYENLMIQPDIFPDLQQKLKVGSLPCPRPDIVIKKSKETKGLLSTFASYLKGDEEPSDEEIQYTLRARECVKTCNIPAALFGNEVNLSSDVIRALLKSLNMQKTSENAKHFEPELLFLTELTISLYLFCKNEQALGNEIFLKLTEVSKIATLSKMAIHRLAIYKLLLISLLKDGEQHLPALLNDDLEHDNSYFDESFFSSPQGSEFLSKLMEITEIDNYFGIIRTEPKFWAFLKRIAAFKRQSIIVYGYLVRTLKEHQNFIVSENFMLILSLFDEISSVGAVGSRYESECKRIIANGDSVVKENPYKDIVDTALKAIETTADLVDSQWTMNKLTSAQTFSVLQVLTHQCINPCEQIRNHAFSLLENLLTKKFKFERTDVETLEELIEGGLVPLFKCSDNSASISIPKLLSLISNVYLYHLKNGSRVTDKTYLVIQNIFSKYMDTSETEELLQNLITNKKQVEQSMAQIAD